MKFSFSETSTSHWRWTAALALLIAGTGGLWVLLRNGDSPPVVSAPPDRNTSVSPAPAEELGNSDLDHMPGTTELPPVMNEAVLNASLAALRAKGADLSRPRFSRHRIVCGDDAVAARVADWARQNGYTPQEPEAYNSHGGVRRLLVDLVRSEVPVPETILAEGRAMLAGMAGIEGALYHTWMSDAPQ